MDISSLLLFSVDISGRHIIKYFSHRHKLHFLLTFEYDRACFILRHLMLYIIFLSFRFQIYLLNSVACLYRSFLNEHATELSKYIWNLKDRNIMYNIKWRKIKQARSYSNVSKKCNLCLWEKYFIICRPEMSTLNNRSELISTCRHSKKFLLKTVLA